MKFNRASHSHRREFHVHIRDIVPFPPDSVIFYKYALFFQESNSTIVMYNQEAGSAAVNRSHIRVRASIHGIHIWRVILGPECENFDSALACGSRRSWSIKEESRGSAMHMLRQVLMKYEWTKRKLPIDVTRILFDLTRNLVKLNRILVNFTELLIHSYFIRNLVSLSLHFFPHLFWDI